ncbi:MAG: threonine synthase [Candidatus Omnitrophica bacterium]|nr:threonine synthase [Candidatus Omnitrophota bacterium]
MHPIHPPVVEPCEVIQGLRCKECGHFYEKDSPVYVCEYDFGPLEVVYDYEKLKGKLTREVIESRPNNLWRYRELLPVESEPEVGLYSGWTPLVKADRLAAELGVAELYIKDDSVNHPTFSYKDRVVSVALSRAKEQGYRTVSCASTGNLGNSVSAHAARAGFDTYIFIPAGLEVGKIVGSLVYNPKVIEIDGNYDDVNRFCSEMADKYSWAFVNVNLRPYYTEGAKTYGFEIAEQLGWKLPQNIVVPVAGGTILPRVYRSFRELVELDLVEDNSPRFFAAQAAGCSPIATAIKEESEVFRPVKPKTIAKSIAIGNPADGYEVMDIARKTGGWGEDATDEEIIDAIKILAQCEGIFTETAGGTTLAVAKKLVEQGRIPRDESLVVCITGNGMKTQEAVANHVGQTQLIQPTVESFERSCLPMDEAFVPEVGAVGAIV